MKRPGASFYHLMFQSTLSSLTIKLTSSTGSWTQGHSSVCHQYGPGTFMWISFHCTNLRTVWLTGSQMLVPVPVVRSRFLFAPDQRLDGDEGGFLVGHHTSFSCLPPLGKILHFPGDLSELQGLSHWGHGGLSVNSQSPGETQCYPTDQTAFTFQWLSQTVYGIGNMY